jgi:hypothetical protein
MDILHGSTTGRNLGRFDPEVSSFCPSSSLRFTHADLDSPALGPNDDAEIGSRPIPVEPMYLIINLGESLRDGCLDVRKLIVVALLQKGLSENFGAIDYVGLEALWPTT